VAKTRPPTSDSGHPRPGARASKRADMGGLESFKPAPVDAEQGEERVVLDDTRIHRALMRIAHEIVESNADLKLLYLVAIPNGGVPLARRLAQNLESLTGNAPRLGILDTTLYRDDLATRGTRPRLRRTEMPSSVDQSLVILVEDVVSTGRTIRAAMDALMDFGRPQSVQVVALVDRGHRELPIKIDYVGKNIPTQPGESVVFRSEPQDESSDEALEVVVQSLAGSDSGLNPSQGVGELA
jgi:pyrimidine operon attenuation protein / uracil phosphoribosyltransferase